MRLLLRAIVAVTIIAVFAVTVEAEVPTYLTYQGRLLDAIGVPVADGPYLIKFRIYDAEAAGTTLWNSNLLQIEVTDGLFSYDLGDTVAIPESLFSQYSSLWLGIKVGTEPELVPRIRLTSSGFAFQALRSDSALNSVTLQGQPAGYYLDWGNLTNLPAGFADGSDDATGPAGGDLSGTFPDPTIAPDAISNTQILDEPGIVQGRSTNAFTLNSTDMVELTTVTITTPADGYIFLQGRTLFRFFSTIQKNMGFLQIDETAGGGPLNNIYTTLGLSAYASGSDNWFDCTSQRTYFKPAGTYTFRLEAQRVSASSGNASCVWPILTALFIPTSYGSVTEIATIPGDHLDAKQVTITGLDESTRTADLRYYELKAKEARLKATAAELELARARATVNDK